MSKLLIPALGQPTKKLNGGPGGLMMGPDSLLHNCNYELMYGCALGQSLLDDDNDESGDADLDVNVLHFPVSQNMLYQTNIGAQSLARKTKHIDTSKGLILAIAAEDYEFAPYYQASATNKAPQNVMNNVFVVGKNGFYMKATLQSAAVADATRIFVGFKKVVTFAKNMGVQADVDEAYGISLVAADIKEYKCLNASLTETDTGANWSNGTDISIEVHVSSAGVCTLHVNGNLQTNADHSVLGMTFDDGEMVYPAIHATNGTNSTLALSKFEFGPSAVL